MKKVAMLSVAAAVMSIGMLLTGGGPAAAASAVPSGVLESCTTSGVGTQDARATCKNDTGIPRTAHFHVDCWAWTDNDADENREVGAHGEVSFHHWCWSHVSAVEAYFI